MEQATTQAKIMIENLVNVVALMSMYRASDRDEYRKTAAEWVPLIERQLAALKEEISK